MDEPQDRNFVEHRVDALTFITLTRRMDVKPTHLGDKGWIDFLVEVKGSHFRQMVFGVVAKGTMNPIENEKQASKDMRDRFAGTTTKRVRKAYYPFPILFLFFDMNTDTGYASWKLEPVQLGKDISLRANSEFDCFRFDRRGLDKAVDQLSSWYERFFDKLLDVDADGD